ncbi:MAG: ferritin-like protein [Geminicoccaceae bacterium]|jgi:ferritin-like metal-binding protein YciE|nr:ferritin-like protein [Geminicoccaceae bacterium]
MNSLQELYVEELKDIYNAEQQILKALPKMAKAASDRQLQRAFTQHEKQTQRQVKRLERIFRELGESPRGKKCKGMEGLIEEGQDLIKERPEPEVLDAGLIAAAQRVEHYEIAAYGTARTYAQQLGMPEQASLLQETLDEEGQTDKLLTALAESSINIEAEHADDDEGMNGNGAGTRANGRRRSTSRGRSGSRRSTRKTARR